MCDANADEERKGTFNGKASRRSSQVGVGDKRRQEVSSGRNHVGREFRLSPGKLHLQQEALKTALFTRLKGTNWGLQTVFDSNLSSEKREKRSSSAARKWRTSSWRKWNACGKATQPKFGRRRILQRRKKRNFWLKWKSPKLQPSKRRWKRRKKKWRRTATSESRAETRAKTPAVRVQSSSLARDQGLNEKTKTLTRAGKETKLYLICLLYLGFAT